MGEDKELRKWAGWKKNIPATSAFRMYDWRAPYMSPGEAYKDLREDLDALVQYLGVEFTRVESHIEVVKKRDKK